MELEARLVALGGLLHDIGKFEQRAHAQKKRHSEFGYEFLKKHVEKYFREYDILPLFAKYHHKDDLKSFKGDIRTKNLLNIVCEADNISSGERKAEEEMVFKLENPLESVFSSVNIGKGNAEKVYYELEIFSPGRYFYPKKNVKNTINKYKELFKGFESEFEESFKKLNFDALLYVLEKYTTFIPAMLHRGKRYLPLRPPQNDFRHSTLPLPLPPERT